MPKNILLDPTSELRPAEREKATPLAGLSGQTIGLLDIAKARGDIFLDRIEERLRGEGAEVIRYSKPTFTKPAPADLRRDIAAECNAVIEALAD